MKLLKRLWNNLKKKKLKTIYYLGTKWKVKQFKIWITRKSNMPRFLLFFCVFEWKWNNNFSTYPERDENRELKSLIIEYVLDIARTAVAAVKEEAYRVIRTPSLTHVANTPFWSREFSPFTTTISYHRSIFHPNKPNDMSDKK